LNRNLNLSEIPSTYLDIKIIFSSSKFKAILYKFKNKSNFQKSFLNILLKQSYVGSFFFIQKKIFLQILPFEFYRKKRKKNHDEPGAFYLIPSLTLKIIKSLIGRSGLVFNIFKTFKWAEGLDFCKIHDFESLRSGLIICNSICCSVVWKKVLDPKDILEFSQFWFQKKGSFIESSISKDISFGFFTWKLQN